MNADQFANIHWSALPQRWMVSHETLKNAVKKQKTQSNISQVLTLCVFQLQQVKFPPNISPQLCTRQSLPSASWCGVVYVVGLLHLLTPIPLHI